MKNKLFLYIFELSKEEQNQIKLEVIEVLKQTPWCDFEADLQRALDGKLIDLEETIDIQKYL